MPAPLSVHEVILVLGGEVARAVGSLHQQRVLLIVIVRAPVPGEHGCGVFNLFLAEFEPLAVTTLPASETGTTQIARRARGSLNGSALWGPRGGRRSG